MKLGNIKDDLVLGTIYILYTQRVPELCFLSMKHISASTKHNETFS